MSSKFRKVSKRRWTNAAGLRSGISPKLLGNASPWRPGIKFAPPSPGVGWVCSTFLLSMRPKWSNFCTNSIIRRTLLGLSCSGPLTIGTRFPWSVTSSAPSGGGTWCALSRPIRTWLRPCLGPVLPLLSGTTIGTVILSVLNSRGPSRLQLTKISLFKILCVLMITMVCLPFLFLPKPSRIYKTSFTSLRICTSIPRIKISGCVTGAPMPSPLSATISFAFPGFKAASLLSGFGETSAPPRSRVSFGFWTVTGSTLGTWWIAETAIEMAYSLVCSIMPTLGRPEIIFSSIAPSAMVAGSALESTGRTVTLTPAIHREVFLSSAWELWECRNDLIFNNVPPSVNSWFARLRVSLVSQSYRFSSGAREASRHVTFVLYTYLMNPWHVVYPCIHALWAERFQSHALHQKRLIFTFTRPPPN